MYGTGTFDEMWDCVCCKKLGMNGLDHKPVCLLNYNGFFDGSIEQLNRANRDQMLYGEPESYYHVVSTIEEAIDYSINEVKRLRRTNKVSITTSKERKLKNNKIHDKFGQMVNNNYTRCKNGVDYTLWMTIGFTVGIITMTIIQKYK